MTRLCLNCGCRVARLLSHPNLGPICPICLAPAGSRRKRGSRNGGPGPRKLQRIAIRDGWRCHLCGELVESDGAGVWAPSLDHLIPSSHGGSNADENLHLAHAGCNNKRGNRPLDLTSSEGASCRRSVTIGRTGQLLERWRVTYATPGEGMDTETLHFTHWGARLTRWLATRGESR